MATPVAKPSSAIVAGGCGVENRTSPTDCLRSDTHARPRRPAPCGLPSRNQPDRPELARSARRRASRIVESISSKTSTGACPSIIAPLSQKLIRTAFVGPALATAKHQHQNGEDKAPRPGGHERSCRLATAIARPAAQTRSRRSSADNTPPPPQPRRRQERQARSGRSRPPR
jgi:hypothetical protein